MSRHGCPLLALWICLAAAGCGDADLRDETPKSAAGTPETAAKAAVREFVAGLRDGKKDAVLRVIDVPYFNHHEFGVVEDRGELERRYDQVLGPWTSSGPLPRTFTGINRYREARGATREGVRSLLGSVRGRMTSS